MSFKAILEKYVTTFIGTVLAAALAYFATQASDLATVSKKNTEALIHLETAVVSLQSSSYNTEYNEIKYELAGEPSHAAIVEAVQVWKDEQKGGKLGSMDTLCKEMDRTHLKMLMEERTVISACRIIAG